MRSEGLLQEEEFGLLAAAGWHWQQSISYNIAYSERERELRGGGRERVPHSRAKNGLRMPMPVTVPNPISVKQQDIGTDPPRGGSFAFAAGIRTDICRFVPRFATKLHGQGGLRFLPPPLLPPRSRPTWLPLYSPRANPYPFNNILLPFLSGEIWIRKNNCDRGRESSDTDNERAR